MKSYFIVIALLLCIVLVIPAYQYILFVKSSSRSTDSYLLAKGCLETDTYVLYPHRPKSLEIGFSSYGEMVTPQTRGLAYDGVEFLAQPNIEKNFYPVEGWLLQYTYFDLITDSTENGVAYALYSNLDERRLEGGRSGNLLAEPIDVIYDGPRRIVAQTEVHIMKDYTNIMDVTQTFIFNKVYKHLVILIDVIFLKTPDQANPVQISFSRRTGLPMSEYLVNFQRGLETSYHYQYDEGYYDLATISAQSQVMAFIAFWPHVSELNLYGLEEWNNPVLDQPYSKIENEADMIVAEWDDIILPGASKRFVIVYGAADGLPEGNMELQYQLDTVFNPWDLNDALNPETTYQWILVGRNSQKDLEVVRNVQAFQMTDALIGFDGINYNNTEIPTLLSSSTAGYHDDLNRLNFKTESSGYRVAGSNLVVVGSLYANMGGEYFNDLTDVFAIYYVMEDPFLPYSINEVSLYAPSSTNNQYYALQEGIAVISTYRDLNGTVGLNLWGVSAEDTKYAILLLGEIDFYDVPEGITSAIIKFDYSKPPFEKGFYNFIGYEGTIMSLEVP